jgi:hypothetical protein
VTKKCKDLSESVKVSNVGTYSGTYSTKNNLTDATYSYYLNGKTNDDNPHFTVAPTGGGKEDFKRFHVTVPVEGTGERATAVNVGIWYTEGKYTNTNTDSLRADQKKAWDAQWSKERKTYDSMAKQFWDSLNK